MLNKTKKTRNRTRAVLGLVVSRFLTGFFKPAMGATSAKREMCAASRTALFFQCKKVTDLVKQFAWAIHGTCARAAQLAGCRGYNGGSGRPNDLDSPQRLPKMRKVVRMPR